MGHGVSSDGGGNGGIRSSSPTAIVNANRMERVGNRMTSSSLETVDLRSTITANRNARMVFVAGESGFASLGRAFVSAGEAIRTVSGGWERTDQAGRHAMENIMGPTL